jgi:uncharacterized membrane protein YphA (DoxX/SURF4 family)
MMPVARAAATRTMAAWDRFWFTPGPALRLGLARAIFCGAAFCFYTPHDFAQWASVARAFWMPIPLFDTLHLSPLPAPWLSIVQVIWKVALLTSAIGLFTRVSTVVAALLAIYVLGLPHNFGATQHYDTLIVFALAILAMSCAGDTLSIDAWWRSHRRRAADTATSSDESTERLVLIDNRRADRGPLFGPEFGWPMRAMWVMTGLVFFGAGTSKLRHSGLEWAFSDNLRLLLMRGYYHVSDGDPLTSWGLTIARQPHLPELLALCTLIIETSGVVALFVPRLRPWAGTAWLTLIVAIRVLMGPTFEPFLICALFCVPWDRVVAKAKALLATEPPPSTIVDSVFEIACAAESSVPETPPASPATSGLLRRA